MGINIAVTKDLSGLDAKFTASQLKAVQTQLAMQVGNDSNVFCKVDTGQTRATMQSSSRFEAGEVSWTTPYASDAYYNPHTRTEKNPRATSRWFETAKSQRLSSWTELVRRKLNGR